LLGELEKNGSELLAIYFEVIEENTAESWRFVL
jgi:hypothetical protein